MKTDSGSNDVPIARVCPDSRISVVVDRREQLPLDFSPFSDVTVAPGTLATGDYSLTGFESRWAIERKSIADLVGSLTSGRDRFMREMVRLARYEYGAVVVEGQLLELESHTYRSKASALSILGSVCAVCVRYVPVFFAGDRHSAAVLVHGLLRRLYLDEQRRLALALESLEVSARP